MTERTNSHSSGSRVGILVLVCFFMSGLTGLIYEILWTRMIVKIIGSAPFAVSIVLTVFMAGLGLGSYLASRIVDHIKQQLKLVRIYGILELVIGGYCFVLPILLKGFLPIYAVVYNRLFEHFILYNFLTFVGCSVLLATPVICMGATLPILCRFYVSRLSHIGTRAGRLYGLNTIGAAAGALLCGFWLISYLGVNGTLVLAVILNGLIGVVSIMASYTVKLVPVKRARESETLLEGMAEQMEEPAYKGAATSALIIFAVSGFCAMAYEVIWTKLLGLIIGPTTYSFTIVLVTFITVLALGSMVFGWVADRIKRPLKLLIYTQVLAALFALLVSHILGNSQFFFAKLIYHFQDSFMLLNVLKAVILFGFMFLPTFCLASTFPLVGKIYTRSVSKVGKSLGFAYAVNTVGAVLGSFCAGFILIPLIGKENGLRLVFGIQMATALVIAVFLLLANRQDRLKLIPIGVLVVLGSAFCMHFPSWNRFSLATGRYQRFDTMMLDVTDYGWLESLLRGSQILGESEHGELVYYGDGIGGFTTVLKETGPFGNVNYKMANSGKTDASSRADMETQTLSAHFPMLFHRDAKTVMVLGLASGITAGEVLYYPIERLDVLEISDQVVAASDFFLPWNNNVLSDPKTELIVQDGRAHLQLANRKYDVITSEPSNPWMAGIAALFTRDFFALVKDRLNDNGIFCQWVHSYQMDWDTFAMIVRTFADVYANGVLVRTRPGDYLLVGFKGIKKLTLENAQRNLPYIQQSKNVVLSDAKLLYRLVVTEDLKQLCGRGPINTDSWPRLEFAAPRMLYRADQMITRNIESKRWLSPGTRDITEQVVTDVDTQIDFAAYALSLYAPFRDMVNLSKATQSQKGRYFQLMDAYCANNPIYDYSIFGNDELKRRFRLVQIEAIANKVGLAPDRASSYFYLADLYNAEGMLDEAITVYLRLLRIKPTEAEAHNNVGTLLAKRGRLDEAVEHYTEALRIKPGFSDANRNLKSILARRREFEQSYKDILASLPEDPDTLNKLGTELVRQEKFPEAIAHFTKALLIEPSSAQTRRNLGNALVWQGDIDTAIVHLTEAIKIDPNFAAAHNDLGVALLIQGKFDQSIPHFEEALKIMPDFADARQNLKYALENRTKSALTKEREPKSR